MKKITEKDVEEFCDGVFIEEGFAENLTTLMGGQEGEMDLDKKTGILTLKIQMREE